MRRAFKLKKSKSEIFNDLKNSRKFNNWENYRENKIKMNVKNSDSIESNITDISYDVLYFVTTCVEIWFLGLLLKMKDFLRPFHLNFDLILVLIKVFDEK